MADQKKDADITDYTKSAYIGSDIPNEPAQYRNEAATEMTPSVSDNKPSFKEETSCELAVPISSGSDKNALLNKNMEASEEIAAPVSLKKQPIKKTGTQNVEASKEIAAPVSLSKQKAGKTANREETAAEIAAPVTVTPGQTAANTGIAGMTAGVGLGYAALALSILALFILPVLFGAAGIVLGFVALRRGAGGLGAWAIGIGIVAMVIGIFILPFV